MIMKSKNILYFLDLDNLNQAIFHGWFAYALMKIKRAHAHLDYFDSGSIPTSLLFFSKLIRDQFSRLLFLSELIRDQLSRESFSLFLPVYSSNRNDFEIKILLIVTKFLYFTPILQ